MADPAAPVPLQDQIAEVGREIGVRKNVYPTFIARQALSQKDADLQTARMAAVYRTLKWLEKHEARIREIAPDLTRTGETTP